MANTDVDVYRRADIDQRIRYATLIADARGLLPDGIHNPAQALLIFEQAAALGIPPITGLSQIHVIKGKPTMSAGLMSGLIRKAGHKLRVWVDGEGEEMTAYAELIRADDPDFAFKAKFSIKDAKAAGLYPGKSDSNWQKYTRPMLKARVTSEIAREGATDVFLGAIYTPEELDPGVEVDELGELVPQPGQGGAQQPNDASRPQTPATTPIVPEAGAEGEVEEWIERVDAVMDDPDALLALFNEGRKAGKLNLKVDESTELGQYIIDLGKRAKARAEAEAGEVDEQTGEVVVDAEVVEDEEPEADPEPPMVMQDEEPKPAPRTRKAPAKK
jgi:hypothetical protein